MTTKAYPVQSRESAYEQWCQPHHEGADWAAFNAGYEAGVRAAAHQVIGLPACRNIQVTILALLEKK